jgi:ABC-type antimicrobial peptide transport system permease subunit
LGASGHDVLRVVLRRTATAIAAGLLIGVAAAVPVSAALARFLIGVSPFDRWSFAAAASSFVLAAAAAVVGPARRAIKTDPLVALRSE